MTIETPFAPAGRPGRRYWRRMRLRTPSATLPLLLVGDGEAVLALHLGAAAAPPAGAVPDRGTLAEAERQLEAYASGQLTRFELPLAPQGTRFQLEVWASLLAVPFGETATYGEVAGRVGRPSAARAVGAAVGANPIGILVPCHRVIGADRSLTGYAGGLDTKVALLALEGHSALAGGGGWRQRVAPVGGAG